MSENKILNVKKRDNSLVPFNVENINKVIVWSTRDISGVSVSDIEINTKLNLVDGISTREIHKVLIESTINLFNEENPNYQWVASRLLNYQLRKDIWGGKNPPRLYDFIKQNTDRNVYHPEILEKYTKSEIDKLDDKISHSRDYDFTYSGLKQLCDKYLIQNRKTKEIFETPQFAYMLAAMVSFINYPQDKRLQYVKRAYDRFSKFKINLPTPQMAGIRGLLKQYASCCLIDVDDTKESIFSSNTAAGFATTQRYGIGLNFGRIRGIGTEIKGGSVIHTGIIPFLKVFEATVKSCQQNGIRGGGATVNFPFWHYEIEDIIVLKNNGGTEDNRVRKVDYVIQFSKLFYERFMKNETITLFSPHEVPELTEAFGLPHFDELYQKYEEDKTIKYKRKIKATNLTSLFVKERTETGRYYVMNIDHCNEHGSFLDRVSMTNLCLTGDTEVLCLIKNKEDNNFLSSILTLEQITELYNSKAGSEEIYVWSKNLDTQENEFKLLTGATMTHPEAELIEITDIETNQTIRCTPDHLIYTNNRGYVKACELLESDTLNLI